MNKIDSDNSNNTLCSKPSRGRFFKGIIDKRGRATLMRLKRELRLNMHAMKAIAIIVVLLLAVVNALELLPAASAFQTYLSGVAVALSLVALIAILVGALRVTG